ncbi:MAG: carboxypeptidase regulatory-like domain-containing protein [Methanobrevibacter sp.]|nr:carboxypeptidase regulatory-like domain-containing protein [Methanobrevibacter sp.]
MFNKKIKLFLMTLVFMLSISAVAAVDSNSTDDMLAGDVDVEPPSGVTSSLAVENDTLTISSSSNYVLTGEDQSSYYSGSNYNVVLSKDNVPVENASVTLKVNGVSYTQTTDSDGKVSIPLNLNEGNYVVYSTYGSTTTKSNVKVLAVVKGSDVTKTYSNSKQYSATFLNENGSPLKNTNVKFTLNGKTYTRKTDAKGVATLDINLNVGNYTIWAIHPNGYKISNKITIKSSISANNVTKHYLSSRSFTATFYGKNGKVLANTYVKFIAHGQTFNVKTNSKGVAKLSIVSKPTTFLIYSVNPQTGEKVTNKVRILYTMSAGKMTVFSDRTSTFKVKIYKNEKLAKNSKVYVYVNGVKKEALTDSDGVASVNFKLASGTYKFKSYDPYTKISIYTTITVKSPTIKASDMTDAANVTSVFTATLLNSDGSVAKNKEMQITLNGVTKTVKTNSYGAASINFKLDVGTYKVVCTDPSNGYTLTKTIKIIKTNVGVSYNQYGVSEDGYSLLAIGRASASGELSKYGYTFYVTEFDRTCPYCGSHELYWSIFFAGSETANWGKFPATGTGEGSSAEGIIVCAKCDSDWSVFGHNHGGNGGDLTVITATKSCTKEDAYTLKSGKYVSS